MTKVALEAQHGSALVDVAELEEAIAAAESAVEIGRDELRLEAGALPTAEFDALAAPYEAKVGRPVAQAEPGTHPELNKFVSLISTGVLNGWLRRLKLKRGSTIRALKTTRKGKPHDNEAERRRSTHPVVPRIKRAQ